MPAGTKYVSLRQSVKTDSGAHPASCPLDSGVYSPGVKRPVGEANHSPPFSAVLKNEWIYTSSPPTCLHGLAWHGVMEFACSFDKLYLDRVFLPDGSVFTCEEDRQ